MSEIEFSHITTRGGDGGKTSLINGERRSKSDYVFEVLGDVDELSSALGIARSALRQELAFKRLEEELKEVQKLLVVLGGELATPPPLTASKKISPKDIEHLEESEKNYIENLKIRGFILPGSCSVCAALDLARSITRRAERHLVRYIEENYAVHLKEGQKFLNRLSDFLFVAARAYALARGLEET